MSYEPSQQFLDTRAEFKRRLKIATILVTNSALLSLAAARKTQRRKTWLVAAASGASFMAALSIEDALKAGGRHALACDREMEAINQRYS